MRWLWGGVARDASRAAKLIDRNRSEFRDRRIVLRGVGLFRAAEQTFSSLAARSSSSNLNRGMRPRSYKEHEYANECPVQWRRDKDS